MENQIFRYFFFAYIYIKETKRNTNEKYIS